MITENLPEPNIPLLRKAVEWAEAEAAKTDGTCLWNQRDYVLETDCGTAYCVAGFAVATAVEEAEINASACLLKIDGEDVLWHDAGRDVLSITDSEAEDLFDDRNDIDDVRRVAGQIAARAGERL